MERAPSVGEAIMALVDRVRSGRRRGSCKRRCREDGRDEKVVGQHCGRCFERGRGDGLSGAKHLD